MPSGSFSAADAAKSALAPPTSPKIRLRPAREDDREQLYEWANDRDMRAMSFGPGAMGWSEFVAWYEGSSANPTRILLVAELPAGSGVGYVRFDLDRQHATVSVALARRQRGRGLGAAILRRACDQLFADSDIARIFASIKPINTPSIRAFVAAGFSQDQSRYVGGLRTLCYVLERA